MKPTKELMKKYADLLVHTGANVQEGQVVLLNCGVKDHEFACMLMEACYQAGAKKVNIDWMCDQQSRLNFQYADTEVLAEVQTWEEEKMKQWLVDYPVRIFIESEDPDALAGLDVEKIAKVSQAKAALRKPYRDAIDGKHQWLIAAIPSEAWAKKCFPELSEEEAVDRLWEAILKCVRVSEDNDPIADWKAHTDFIIGKAAWMNEQHFTSLHYTSSNGTDFTVELIPDARWEGAGSSNSKNGAYYIPNMPTEEVFTSPLAGSCEGTLVSVKALSWNSQVIDNFSITFENGRAVSCKAEKGQEMLEKMIAMDENAAMLGEVALVPKESPVNQCGFLFYNTLFDENACCHMALGSGFKMVLPEGDDMSSEEAFNRGINSSIIHVDFMVGADDLEIVGTKADGSQVQIFKNGTWA